jgi:L-fuconolactonase
MLITDAQAHLWKADSPERPWPAGGASYAHGTEDYTAEMLLAEMEKAGVDRAVLVPPSFEGDRNDVCQAAAIAHPDRFAVMGRITLDDPASSDLVPSWRDQPGMLGFRLTFSRLNHRAWLEDGTADWLWAAAEKAGVPLMVFAPGSTEHIRSIAQRHPGLRLVIDHLGINTELRDDQIDGPIDEVVTLADLDNVAVKASSLPSVVTESYPFPSLHGRIEKVVDAFGPRRVFWGCDVTRLPCTYRQGVTLFTEELDFLGHDELEWIMGRGIEEWLGWDVTR